MKYLIPFLLLMACGATANTCNGPATITWNERLDPTPAPADMASAVTQRLLDEDVDAGSPDLQERVLAPRPEELPPIVSDPTPDMDQDQEDGFAPSRSEGPADGFAPPWGETSSSL